MSANPKMIFLADTICCKAVAADGRQATGFSKVARGRCTTKSIGLNDDVASRWGPRLGLLMNQLTAGGEGRARGLRALEVGRLTGDPPSEPPSGVRRGRHHPRVLGRDRLRTGHRPDAHRHLARGRRRARAPGHRSQLSHAAAVDRSSGRSEHRGWCLDCSPGRCWRSPAEPTRASFAIRSPIPICSASPSGAGLGATFAIIDVGHGTRRRRRWTPLLGLRRCHGRGDRDLVDRRTLACARIRRR